MGKPFRVLAWLAAGSKRDAARPDPESPRLERRWADLSRRGRFRRRAWIHVVARRAGPWPAPEQSYENTKRSGVNLQNTEFVSLRHAKRGGVGLMLQAFVAWRGANPERSGGANIFASNLAIAAGVHPIYRRFRRLEAHTFPTKSFAT